MKRQIVTLLSLALGAVLILVFLNLTNGSPNRHNNGFQRQFLNVKASTIAHINFTTMVRGVCGIIGDSVFLSSNIPGKIYLTSNRLNHLDTFNLNLPYIKKLPSNYFTIVQFPKIYILGGNARCIISGNLLSNKYEIKKFPIGPFTNAVKINNESFVMRVIDTNSLDATFKRFDLIKNELFDEKDISDKLGDAGFINDGQLSFDKNTSRLLYTCYYRNSVTCFNTDFKLLYKSKTVDTNTLSSVLIMKKGGGVTHSAPPKAVNSGNCAFKGRLFVKSKLKADNEDASAFNKNEVIDIYDETNGHYIGSFYLPEYKNQKFNSFYVLDNRYLIACYDKDVVCYKI